MNLRSLSDETLIQKTEALVQQERELLTAILHHLREIETRRLFSALGFKSLFDYAVRKLGYSGDQAARRIAAMRLLKALPEVEAKIESGALTLTNISMAQNLFRKEVMARSEKMDLLARLENKSTREAEKIVLSRSSNPIELKPDRTRAISADKIEIRFVANAELNEKLEKVKGLLAHSHPDCSMADLVDKLCDLAIEKFTPSKRIKPKPLGAPMEPRATKAAIRREVWRRAGDKCENCGSTHALQIDHVQPLALGGGNEVENLRLLCRNCNQRLAIEKLGRQKMSRFLDRPTA